MILCDNRLRLTPLWLSQSSSRSQNSGFGDLQDFVEGVKDAYFMGKLR